MTDGYEMGVMWRIVRRRARRVGRAALSPALLMLYRAGRRDREPIRQALDLMELRHPALGQVRGHGATMAVEIIDPTDRAPASATASAISQHCFRHGVVTLVTGTYGNVIRFLPPLSIPADALAEALDVFADAVAACT